MKRARCTAGSLSSAAAKPKPVKIPVEVPDPVVATATIWGIMPVVSGAVESAFMADDEQELLLLLLCEV
jgi:hypothetical protein